MKLNISIQFQVDYLGSVFLSNRSSDLFSLQKPLKSLYFKYLENKLTGSAEEEAKLGTLEITKTGLKVSQSQTFITIYSKNVPKLRRVQTFIAV